MTTATLTANRFGLVDSTGRPYRGLSFGTEKAALQYHDRLPEKFRRMVRTAGFRVGPIETPAPAPAASCCPADEPAPCLACSTTPAEPPAVSEDRPVKARASRPGTTRLTLAIGDQSYAVRRLDVADRSFGVVKAVRLRRLDNGELYDVAQTIDGHTCTCADVTFRHPEGDARCKHVKSLIAWELLG